MSYLIAALVATVLLLILAIQNPGPAEVRFLFWHGSLPLVLLLLVTTVVGGALTVGGAMPHLLRDKRQLRELAAKLRAAEDELARHRSPEVPADDDQVAASASGGPADPPEAPVPGMAEAAQGLQESPK